MRQYINIITSTFVLKDSETNEQFEQRIEERFALAMKDLVTSLEERMEIKMQSMEKIILDRMDDKLMALETRFTSALIDLTAKKDGNAKKSEMKQKSVSVGEK